MTPNQQDASGRGPRVQPRRPRQGWESLTPTEAKIAALAVEGMTNPQIATRLFLSQRTVATHVSHILRKLNVRSRIDIARAAATRDALDAIEVITRDTALDAVEVITLDGALEVTGRPDPMSVVEQLIEPDQKKRRVLPNIRSRERVPARQPALSVCRLSAVATWLLPAGERTRYAEEWRSELHDLASEGAGRPQQLRYATRLLVRAVPLRLAVLAPRREKASP